MRDWWQILTRPFADNLSNNSLSEAGDECGAVHVTVNGTTVMGIYEVRDAAVLLTSVDFGDASAVLGGAAPDAAAASLLQEMVEAAMVRSDALLLARKTRPRKTAR